MIDFGLSDDYSELKVMQTPVGSVRISQNYINIFIAILYCPWSIWFPLWLEVWSMVNGCGALYPTFRESAFSRRVKQGNYWECVEGRVPF